MVLGLGRKKTKDEDAKKEELATAVPVVPGVEVVAGFPVQLFGETNLVVDEKDVAGCVAVFKSGLMAGSEWEQLVALVQEGAEARVIIEQVAIPEPPKPKE